MTVRRPNSKTPEIEYLPPDLAPLPYGASTDDEDAVRTALYLNYGNVGLAARQLGCLPGALARQIELVPSLKADRDAARRMIVDQSEAVIVEELLDDNCLGLIDDHTTSGVTISLERGEKLDLPGQRPR